MCNVVCVQWHSLSREEQAKYYEKARQERQLHMQLYPGWSARDNYGYGTKKKKRKKERTPIESGGSYETPTLINRVLNFIAMQSCVLRLQRKSNLTFLTFHKKQTPLYSLS